MGVEKNMSKNDEPKVLENQNGGAKWREFPGLLWRGMGMGVAEAIPGVSGGTIALITGVLGRMVDAIHSVDMTSIGLLIRFRLQAFFERVHWKFLLMLFSGQLLGILMFTKVIPLPSLLRSHPEPLLGLFFGVILGSIILLARQSGKPGLKGILAYAGGLAIGSVVVASVRASTPDAPWFLAVSGALAICAWILPGISGSFILLLLHKYDVVWEAVTFSNGVPFVQNVFTMILPFALGALAGLVTFARVLSFVMNRWPKRTTMAMNGLLIASLWAIFPFQHAIYETVSSGKEKLVAVRPYLPSMESMDTMKVLALVFMVTGFGLILWVDRLARKANPSQESTQTEIPGETTA